MWHLENLHQILTLWFIQVLREGSRGYGILVSSVPKESKAFYSVRDPSEVENPAQDQDVLISLSHHTDMEFCAGEEVSQGFGEMQEV